MLRQARRAPGGDRHVSRRHLDAPAYRRVIAPRVGEALAKLHLAGADFALRRANALGIASWRHLYEPRSRAPTAGARASARRSQRNSRRWTRLAARPAGGRDPRRSFPRQRLLPRRRLSRPDRFLFRLQRRASPTTSRSASTPGASRPTMPSTSPRAGRCCRPTRGARRSRRGARGAAGPGARRGAALPADAAGTTGCTRRAARWCSRKDPLEYLPQAALPPLGRHASANTASNSELGSASTIYTDGACSGNPGPGGWGAMLTFGDREKEICRRRSAHHQQPHGADGGDRRRWRR